MIRVLGLFTTTTGSEQNRKKKIVKYFVQFLLKIVKTPQNAVITSRVDVSERLMEAVLAVIRPNKNQFGSDFKSKLYEILLLDTHKTDRHSKAAKYLPKFSLDLSSKKEPRDEILSFVLSMTGGDHAGIKGERALVVPWKDTKDSNRSSLQNVTLYCIPISHRDKLNSSFVEKSPNSPGFYSMDSLLSALNSSSITFPSQTKTYVTNIEHWLKEKHSKHGALDLVFRSRADFRVKLSVNNPVFLPTTLGPSLRSEYPEEIKNAANESLARMMEIEKCTKVVINPLFGSGLIAKGRRKPMMDPPVDYPFMPGGTLSRKSSITSTMEADRFSLIERDSSPLHMFAAKGDVLKVQDCISKHISLTQRDTYGWAPIHFAAWNGHHDIVHILLQAGCSPNIVNSDDRTPLHLAAKHGHLDVVDVLLSHQEIDMNAIDKKGQTALDMCEQKLSWEHIEVRKRILLASRQPKQIQVFLMDGTNKSLNLEDGANTSVDQLNQQMLREFNMPETPYADIFTIWICSPSLELQLKPEHKPLEQMSSWKRRIVGNLTDGDPKKEEPHLKWRRNAKISLIVEREVTHPDAISLLFFEARWNYINAFYPCKEQDVWLFASILLYLNFGHQDQSGAKTFLHSHKNLQQLVPAPNLKKNSNLSQKIYNHYREMCNDIISRANTPRIGLLNKFLNNCRNLTVYGSAFFTGSLQPGGSRPSAKDLLKCFIAVNDVGIHIINYQSRLMLHSYKYSEITWQLLPEYGNLQLTVVGLRSDSRPSDRHSHRQTLKLVTKQAGMINHLMRKLSRMSMTYTM